MFLVQVGVVDEVKKILDDVGQQKKKLMSQKSAMSQSSSIYSWDPIQIFFVVTISGCNAKGLATTCT